MRSPESERQINYHRVYLQSCRTGQCLFLYLLSLLLCLKHHEVSASHLRCIAVLQEGESEPGQVEAEDMVFEAFLYTRSAFVSSASVFQQAYLHHLPVQAAESASHRHHSDCMMYRLVLLCTTSVFRFFFGGNGTYACVCDALQGGP